MAVMSFSTDEKTKGMLVALQHHLQENTFTKVTISDVIRYAIENAYREHLGLVNGSGAKNERA